MYFMYLRKSRKDLEAEQRGEGETLARHRRILYELADRMKISIDQVYQEVVSGDTIAARPQMQKLLADIESGECDGVFVMEVERLARGDSIDQGIVAQTFKYSNTKIITPVKTYDPNNIYDEEYFEFSLYMSRREYSTIKRRMAAGRLASISEGKYLSNKPPYGYDRIKLSKGYTLTPNDQADTVRNIFKWYTDGYQGERLGTTKIAHKLNELHVPTMTGGIWTTATIQGLIKNPVYIGKIRWNGRKSCKTLVDGHIVVTRPRNKDPMIVDGLHPAIISDEVWNRAQEIITINRPAPVNRDKSTKNPLSGIMVCGVCGRKMTRRPYQNRQMPSLICPVAECTNVSSDLEIVERAVIEQLQDVIDKLKAATSLPIPEPVAERDAITAIKTELSELDKQQDQVRTLLERGIYDIAVYQERNTKLEQHRSELLEEEKSLESKIQGYTDYARRRMEFIPRVEQCLQTYWDETPTRKNELLKSIIEYATYYRRPESKWKNQSDFNVELFLRI